MPKVKAPQVRVNVQFSRRFDLSSRNGQLWDWVKGKYSYKEWNGMVSDMAYVFFSALREAEGSCQDKNIQKIAIAEFSDLLAQQIDKIVPSLNAAELPPRIEVVSTPDDDDDDFTFEADDDE